jgi:Core-2/I-Branching enzyme
MKIAYLVFAYKNPQLLRREIEALSSANSVFFVHIDKKCNLDDFSLLRGDRVFFLDNRYIVYWAEFSGVLAILALIQRALQGPEHYDYLVLLSGSEYPLRSRSYIEDFFEDNNGSQFIDMVKIPNRSAGKPLSHINAFRVQSTKPFLRLIVKALARLGCVRRDYRNQLGALEPYGGHTWWALTRDACQYICNFVDHNPRVVRFFENASQPEETFFHTILGNSEFKSRIRRNLVYEDWSAGGARPAMIGEKHIAYFEAQQRVCINDAFGSGEVLFARKYCDENLGALGRIDAMIERDTKR